MIYGADLTSKLRPPAPGPVPWRIVRLRGTKNPKLPPIVTQNWDVARAFALVTYHCEPWEVELEQMKEDT